MNYPDRRRELFAHYGIGLEPTDEAVDFLCDLLERKVDRDLALIDAINFATDSDREELAAAIGCKPEDLDPRKNNQVVFGVLARPGDELSRQLGLIGPPYPEDELARQAIYKELNG